MYRFLVSFTNPYAALHVILAAAFALLWFRRRDQRRWLLLVVVPWLLLVVVSLPIVAYVLLGTLEWDYPPRTDWPADARAIVVLSAGSVPPDSVRPRAMLTSDSLYRCMHAADVYRHYKPSGAVPVIASGGKVEAEIPGPGLSELMRDFLLDLGVDAKDIVIENRSRTTHENAVETARLLRERGIGEVILVTDAVHMRRAGLCFREAGIDVVPSACCHGATDLVAPYYRYVIPNVGTVIDCDRVVHEWLGVAWYRLRGYI